MSNLESKPPLISVVLPVYNGQKYLREAIDSVIDQTYQNWELIIVDDCSTDNSFEIIQEYASNEKRIKIIRNDENKKLPASLNIGFENASGEFYTWTSDDNYYYPQALEKLHAFLVENPKYGMAYAKCRVLGTYDGDFWGDTPTTPKVLLDFPVPAACFLYRQSIACKVGEYDTSISYAEDHDYWLRLLMEAPIGNLNEELYAYRRHEASLTITSGDKAVILRKHLFIKYLPLYVKKFPELQERRCRKALDYKKLRYLFEFQDNKSLICLKIANLGGKYVFKALLMYWKHLRTT